MNTSRREASPERVPVLVVSGFLGSGKTTLVRRLLAEAQHSGERLAVISNEFGELGIDSALLGEGAEAFVELAGGCVCCKLSDELIETLELLRERVQPDRVIIETSGIALPYDTQLNFYREPVSRWIGDDVAVVVVDAEQVAAGRELEDTFAAQVSSADLLVLNKTDLVSAEALDAAERFLRTLEPDAPLIRAVQAELDPVLLFPPDPIGLRARRRAVSAEPRSHSHECFEAEELVFDDGGSEPELVRKLVGLGALRVKGFVRTKRGLRLVQGVGSRVELVPVSQEPAAELIGRLVVIRRAQAPAPARAARGDD